MYTFIIRMCVCVHQSVKRRQSATSCDCSAVISDCIGGNINWKHFYKLLYLCMYICIHTYIYLVYRKLYFYQFRTAHLPHLQLQACVGEFKSRAHNFSANQLIIPYQRHICTYIRLYFYICFNHMTCSQGNSVEISVI